MTSSAETRLIEQARQGDVAAFEELVGQYEKRVYNLAYRMTGNHEDASDMAQEAFIRVYKSLADFRGESSFSTWLLRIAANACRDELRRQQRQKTTSLYGTVEADDGEMPRQYADPGDAPDRALERQETRRLVREVIDTLDEDHRMVLILRDFQDLSYDRIAEVLDCSLGTVKSRLNRARQAFKEKFARQVELFNPRFVSRSRRRQGNEV